MIEQFYLDLYPVLTQDWRELGQRFGSINYDVDVETSHRDLSARVYIFVGNNWSKACLEVRHRLHGTATYNPCHAKQPAKHVWRVA